MYSIFLEELSAFVKREFQSFGYYSPHFAALPVDMSEGSRELLLAFGWILSQAQIIEKFMMTCTDPLDDDTLSLHYVSAFKVFYSCVIITRLFQVFIYVLLTSQVALMNQYGTIPNLLIQSCCLR